MIELQPAGPHWRPLNRIVIHCAATRPSMDIGKAEITKWHVTRGWRTIGYHFVIRRNGDIEQGRPIVETGAHVENHNRDSIGICLVGGITEQGKPRPEANFTPDQWAALGGIVKILTKSYPTITTVLGHRDLDPMKACPCFDAGAWWDEAKKRA